MSPGPAPAEISEVASQIAGGAAGTGHWSLATGSAFHPGRDPADLRVSRDTRYHARQDRPGLVQEGISRLLGRQRDCAVIDHVLVAEKMTSTTYPLGHPAPNVRSPSSDPLWIAQRVLPPRDERAAAARELLCSVTASPAACSWLG